MSQFFQVTVYYDPNVGFVQELARTGSFSVLSDFSVAGSLSQQVASISANQVTNAGYYLVDAGDNNVTLTLPDATQKKGATVTVKKIDATANSVIIVPQGNQTIDNETSISIIEPMVTIVVLSDGSNWWIV